MNDEYKKIGELIDKRTSLKMIQEAYREIQLTKKSVWQYAVGITSGIILGALVGKASETVEIMRGIVDNMNSILLAYIAIILGSYSIFQALLNKDIVNVLIKSKGNLLKESNKTFLNLIILYVISIFGNFLLMIILKVIPDDYLLIDNMMLCNVIAGIMIAIYIMIHVVLILEIINFGINLYRMFCAYNAVNALNSLEDDDE